VKRPDLLLLVAIWASFSAFLYLIGIAGIATFVFPAPSLFWIPVGTVLGVVVLFYLTKPEVREYFEDSN